MALTFPSSPTIGQQYIEGNKKWQWTGSVWDAVNTSDLQDGLLILPTHDTPDTVEGSIVWNATSDTVTVGVGLNSVEMAKTTDIPTVLTDLSITDGTAGQLLQTDGAGNFTFETVSGVSSTLAGLTDVDVTGESAGQVLTTDGAGNYTFTTVSGGGGGYGDSDVATYLDGNLSANIIPDTDYTYDIGSSSNKIKFLYTSRAYINELAANYMYYSGDIYLSANTGGTPNAVRPYSTAYTSNLGTTAIPWNDTYTNTITVNTSLSVDGTVNTDMVPDTSITHDLGKSTSRWNEVHAGEGFFDDINATTYTTASQMRFTSGSDFIFAGSRINGTAANTLDIGESTFPMKAIHTNNLTSYTTLTIPINNTPNTADGSMTWDGTNNKLYVGDGSTAIEIGAGGGGSVALDDVTDVTAAGSTAGQMLTSDGAGAYTFTTPYGNSDVQLFLQQCPTNILPNSNNSRDLGGVSNYWNQIFGNNVNVNRLSVATSVNTNLVPNSSDTLRLGINGTRWQELWVNNLDLSASTSFVIPNNTTAQTADGAMTWNATTNKLYVGDGTTAIEIGAGSYSDTDVATYLNGNLNTHIVPDTNAAYDLGTAEKKIRHLFLSDNSIKFVNAADTEFSMGVDGDGELTFNGSKVNDSALAKVTSADLDMAGNRVLFANVYTNLADLPDATAYHGMFAHVHSEAAAYYAHAGSWVKLANDGAGGGGATTLDALTDVTAAGSANGEVLTSDGAGAFTFQAVTAQLGRNQYAGTTASLADQASGDLDVTGCKTYTLFKISTDVAAWVVLYTDAASRTADTRTYADKGSDPSTGGVVAEVITTGAETIIIAPGVIGFNNEGTPTSNMPMKVFNDSGGAATVTVTVDVLTLEV